MRNISGRKVVIIGAARQGIALARFLITHGAEVVLTDIRLLEDLSEARASLADLPIQWVCGEHPLSLLDKTDLLCPSGGVPFNLPLITEAKRRAIPLYNDSQLFLESAPCKVIGITGSSGKSTTTTLVGRIALPTIAAQNNAGKKSTPYNRIWMGGNLGAPLIAVLDELQPNDLAVMELSSFQLELMTTSPDIAAVLNVTPNHLDRHINMEAYIAAKARILQYQSSEDIAVLGRDDPGAWGLAEYVCGRLVTFSREIPPMGQAGSFLREDNLFLQSEEGIVTHIMSCSDISIRGEHNLYNVLAACAISHAAGLSVEAMRSGVVGFTGVAHRLEFVRSWGGADWYNDSIATAPERAMAAIRSFNEPLVMLVGGRDKNLPWEDFARLVSQRVDHLILFGEAANKIELAFNSLSASGARKNEKKLDVIHCTNLQQAVQAAVRVISPGDVVLLSPGGTSFDEFRDFEDRGEAFRQWVMELP